MSDRDVRLDFETFVQHHWSSLMGIGLALSASRADAEDLVQTALTSAYVRWRRIERKTALAYLRRSILNTHIDRWRRHRGAEVLIDLPDQPAPDSSRAVDDRHAVLSYLRALPARPRAVLVLRYLCDLPDADIATTLGISVATVRSNAHRGLNALRAQADSHASLEVPR